MRGICQEESHNMQLIKIRISSPNISTAHSAVRIYSAHLVHKHESAFVCVVDLFVGWISDAAFLNLIAPQFQITVPKLVRTRQLF